MNSLKNLALIPQELFPACIGFVPGDNKVRLDNDLCVVIYTMGHGLSFGSATVRPWVQAIDWERAEMPRWGAMIFRAWTLDVQLRLAATASQTRRAKMCHK